MAIPTWIHEAQALGSIVGALAAAAIAYAGIRIAHRQSVTAAQKLRLDMFPLRFSVYKAAFFAIIHVTAEPNIKDASVSDAASKSLTAFLEKLLESRFLFNKENYEYFDTLSTELIKFKRLTERLQRTNLNPENARANQLYEEQAAKEEWLSDQLRVMPRILESQMKVDETSSFSEKPLDKDDLSRQSTVSATEELPAAPHGE